MSPVLPRCMSGRKMPKITEITRDLELMDSTLFSDTQEPRSPGTHLSAIIQDYGIKLGYMEPFENDDENVRQSRFTLGFVWENFVSTQMRDTAIMYSNGTIFRPPELTVDGIHMSPDAFDITLPGLREYKCTSKSMGREIESTKFWNWWTQIKAYCYGMQVNDAILQVMFLQGNYKDRSGAHQRAWHAEFSDFELEENWRELMNHYKTMKT